MKSRLQKFCAQLLLLCICVFAYSAPLPSQTVDEVEKRIANLPAEQRTYERFRYWVITTLPSDQQVYAARGDAGLFVRYRDYLKTRGFSEAEADAQIKTIQAQGTRGEAERWNRILTAEKPAFNTKPNEFLMEMAKERKPGTALDVGMGQGRNAIWLAQQGWDVTGFDPAEKAVALANETAKRLGVAIKTEVKSIEDFEFGENRWDLILLSYTVGGREIPDVLQRALKPGGLAIIESFLHDAKEGATIGFDPGELPKLYPQLRVVRYEEPLANPDFGSGKMRLVRYCAERSK
jgi:SAM-dependent methyltransferase